MRITQNKVQIQYKSLIILDDSDAGDNDDLTDEDASNSAFKQNNYEGEIRKDCGKSFQPKIKPLKSKTIDWINLTQKI